MNSFSSRIKSEITQKKVHKDCCGVAACYAVACFSKYFDDKGLVLQTENEDVALYVRRLFRKNGIAGTILTKNRNNGALYEFSIKEVAEVKKLHALFGTTGRELSVRILPRLFVCSYCVREFVAAAFLCAGTATDPQKEYNLEFSTTRFRLSQDMEGLLAEHLFAPHRVQRKSAYIIYVKASEKIEDLLTFMGAANASMELMNHKVYKSLRNRTNRLTNCDTANLEKSSRACVASTRAIRYLQQCNQLQLLPPQLLETAQLRLQYPDESLAQLAQRFEPPLSKSGLSHRMKRLEALAEEWKRKNAAKDDLE